MKFTILTKPSFFHVKIPILVFTIYRFWLFGGILSIIPLLGNAENLNFAFESDTLLADKYFQKARLFQDAAYYDSSLYYLKKATTIYEKAAHWEKYVEGYNTMAEIYTWLLDHESWKSVSEHALSVCLKHLGSDHSQVGLAYMYIGFYYYNKGNVEKAWSFYQKALDISHKALGESHPQLADIYIKRSFCFTEKGDFKGTLSDLVKAEQIYLQAYGLNHAKTAHTYDCFSHAYFFKGDFDQVIKQSLKGLSIKRKVLRSEHPDLCMNYNNIGLAYSRKGDYYKGLEYIILTVDILKSNYGPYHEQLQRAYNNIGYCYGKKGDYNQQLLYLEKALEIALKIFGETQTGAEGIYHNIGSCYNLKGDYDKALIYLEKSLPLTIKYRGELHRDVAACYNQLGNVFSNKRAYEKALECYEKEYVIYSKLYGEEHPNVALAVQSLGESYKNLGRIEQALSFYQKALNIRLKILGAKNPEVANNYDAMGSAYRAKGNTKQALSYYQKALDIRLEVLGFMHPDVATSYNHIGNIYLRKKNWTKALNSFQYALKCLVPQFQDDRIDKNPDLQNTGPKLLLLNSLDHKASALYQKWQTQKGTDRKSDSQLADLKLSLNTYQLAIGLIDTIRLSYNTEGSRQELADKSMPLYQNAIQVAHELYIVTEDRGVLEQAFHILEKSKAFILLEALKEGETKKFAGIPDTLVAYQESLKLDLAFFEQQLMEARLDNDSSRTALYKDYLFNGQVEYDKLINHLEKAYPLYYQLKCNVNVVSIKQAQQQLLNKNSTLLEYFVGDSSIFVFLLKPNDYQLYKIDRDFPLEEWVDQMRKGIYYYQVSGKTDQSTYLEYSDTFALASARLFQKLIAPFKNQLSEKLVIIPDGILNYIPFEALLMQLPQVAHRFKNHEYLLYQHQISYNYSTTLLERMTNKQNNASKKLLAFAPEFEEKEPLLTSVENRRGELGALAYNISEVAQINTIISGDVFTGKEATEDNFTRLANNYQILHLATHGKANDKMGNYSYLAFTEIKDSVENEFLYVRDLYNLKLNAEMVVLSACETGIGELQQGEGVISLARGFSYAGAKSILTTLWSVNDKETKELMKSFYLNIKNGMDKDEAIRKAKLEYIDNHSHRGAHPFYWAAFVPIGNMEPIYGVSSFSNLIKFCLLGLGVILLFGWWRNRAEAASKSKAV